MINVVVLFNIFPVPSYLALLLYYYTYITYFIKYTLYVFMIPCHFNLILI